MRTFIVNYNWPLEYKGTYQVTVEDSLTANIDAADKVHKYLIEKFGEVKDSSSSTIIEVYDGTIHKIDDTKDEEWSEEDIKKIRSEEYTKGFNDAAFGGKAWRPSKEQMEVDFDDEFAKFNIGMYNPFNSRAEIYDFARHFYELGLNAKNSQK